MTPWNMTCMLLVSLLVITVWASEGSSDDGVREMTNQEAPIVDGKKLTNGKDVIDDTSYDLGTLLEDGDDKQQGMNKEEELDEMREYDLDTDRDEGVDDEGSDVAEYVKEREEGSGPRRVRRSEGQGRIHRSMRRRGQGRRVGRRGRGGRNRANEDGDDDEDVDTEEPTSGGRRGAGRRRGNRRRGGNRRQDNGSEAADTEESESNGSDTGMNGGGRRRGGNNRRGGRGGRRGPGHGGRGGRRRGGRRPNQGGRNDRRRADRGKGILERLLKDYSESNGRFALSLYKEMVKDTDNFAISPFSVHSALAMVLLGTTGPAKRELIEGLSIQSPVHPAYKGYNEGLPQGDNENGTLMLANAVYTRPGFTVRRAYRNKLRRFYGTSVNSFADENPEEPINVWVADQTSNMIDDFLEEGEVTDDMQMMLLNAVYFKALWDKEFEQDETSVQPFTDKDGDSHDVLMMGRKGDYQLAYSEDLGATAIRIPYRGNRYSFTVLLPDEDTDLNTVEESLTFETLNATIASLAQSEPSTINLQVPKFSMDTEAPLKSKLRSLGINKVFESTNNAFRRMSLHNITIGEVKHRCILEVDEEGTEAAAVTGITFLTTSMSPSYNLDRPFMFLIRDDQLDMNLFVGRYVDPQGDNLEEVE